MERWRAAWDELATDAAAPFCAPAWMLAWWRRAAPSGAAVLVAVVHAGERLIGVVPLFAVRAAGPRRWSFLGAGTSFRTEPLALAGAERDVACASAHALDEAGARPSVVRFRGVPSSSPWPAAFRDAWAPRRGTLHADTSRVAPTIDLRARSFDDWLSSRSHKFRKHLRRARRELERAGAAFAQADGTDAVGRAITELARLHHARFAARGGSSVMTPRVERMLHDVAAELPASRFRVWTIEIGDRVVSAHLFVAAGGEVSYWLGGFDDGWAGHSPGMVTVLAAVEDAWRRGDARIDLGGGAQDYKARFADGEERLDWTDVVSPGPWSLAARALLVPGMAYRALPERARDRVRAAAASARRAVGRR